MDGWKTILSYLEGNLSGAMLNFGGVPKKKVPRMNHKTIFLVITREFPKKSSAFFWGETNQGISLGSCSSWATDNAFKLLASRGLN